MLEIDLLREAELLRGLSDAQLRNLIDISSIATFQQHEVVFAEHSQGHELYIILEGQVSVAVDPARLGTVDQGAVELRTIHPLGPGEAFGEIAFLTGQPRNATIVATRDHTRLLVIPPQSTDTALQTHTIVRNIAVELSRKLRYSNTRIIEDTLATYYINVLVEELATGSHECSPVVPLQHLTVIRNPESFILSGPARLLSDLPAKEVIEVALFAERATLQALVAPGTPAGQVIFSALFSIMRTGMISARVADPAITFVLATDDRRHGTLTVTRAIGDQRATFTLRWQLKGARIDAAARTAMAFLFVQVWTDQQQATHAQASQIIANIAMPVQRSMLRSLQDRTPQLPATRVLVIHHRSHEVARTLRTLQVLGLQIDSFIGIPYGDISWEYITMLDHASGGVYLSLRQITSPTQPARYEFDFRQSSFLDRDAEHALATLYRDPAHAADYLGAMQALAEYRLVRALQTCQERGERLVIYEDGGYLAARIAAIYDDGCHQAHALVRAAIADGTILGVIEVTVAGERTNLRLIEQRGGQALLPVLSNARSELKAIYEAIGVSEAVIHAAATAFGRLGLPTFQARRVAVVGGNGAIGTRLVEQLTSMHNSTANVFAVDLAPQPFALPVDAEHTPHAAHRLAYRALPRYLVSDTCLPVILDSPLSTAALGPDHRAVADAIVQHLPIQAHYRELALTNSYPLAPDELAQLWAEVAQQSGYQLVEDTAFADGGGRRALLRCGTHQLVVTLLPISTVLTFADCARPLRSGVSTVIGCTGYPVFDARHLDAFFARPGPLNEIDSLALISASSKDYEFRRAIDLLDMLLQLTAPAALAADLRLAWFHELYQSGLCFVRGAEFVPLQRLLASPLDHRSIELWRAEQPALAAAIWAGSAEVGTLHQQLADYLQRALRQRVSIRKDIRPDIGTIYQLTINGRAKQLVLLADGFVVNFFARHEKGVKTEYIDPIMTMQLLGLVRLATDAPPPGLHKIDALLRPEDLTALWQAIEDSCIPLNLCA